MADANNSIESSRSHSNYLEEFYRLAKYIEIRLKYLWYKAFE
jgi:hypothetical protein